MKRTTSLFCLWIVLAHASYGQNQWNLTEIGHLPNDTSSNGQTLSANDIWGYVAPGGREYALVGKVNGLSIVSLENPSQPAELFFTPGTPSIWRDIKTFGTYAYVCNDDGGGVRVYDLGNLPTGITVHDSILPGVSQAHNLWIEGNRLYVMGSAAHSGGMGVYDLSNPIFPQFLGAYTGRYVHDAYVRNKVAYLAEITSGFLTILDCSDPTNLSKLGETTYPGAFTHNTWLNDASTVCFTTDEYAGAAVRAWSIKDPTDIQQISHIRSSVSQGNATPHNVHVLNDYLITSYYADGVHLVDASRPESLVEIGYFKTGGATWGAYPYLPSGLVIASDISLGLFVLSPTYQRAAFLEGIVVDSVTGKGLSGVDIRFSGPTFIPDESTDVNGDYEAGALFTGTLQVSFSKYGYAPKIINVDLEQGKVRVENVRLHPLRNLSQSGFVVVDSGSGMALDQSQIALREPISDTTFWEETQDGSVYFKDLFAGTYEVIAGQWGYQTKQVSVSLQEEGTLDTIYLNPGYYDDFSLRFGWERILTTLAGRWMRAEPLPGYYQDSLVSPPADLANDFGKHAMVTQNAFPDGTAAPVRSGLVRWVSPPMDFRSYENPYLFYHYSFVGIEILNDSLHLTGDSLVVHLSTRDTSILIHKYEGYTPDWQLDSIKLADYPFLQDSMVELSFTTANQELNHIVEAALDQIWVEDRPIPVNTAIADLQAPQWQVYPNPVGDACWIRSLDGKVLQGEWQLYDLQGRLLTAASLNAEPIAFPYPAGVYVLQFRDQAGQTSVRKLIKQ